MKNKLYIWKLIQIHALQLVVITCQSQNQSIRRGVLKVPLFHTLQTITLKQSSSSLLLTGFDQVYSQRGHQPSPSSMIFRTLGLCEIVFDWNYKDWFITLCFDASRYSSRNKIISKSQPQDGQYQAPTKEYSKGVPRPHPKRYPWPTKYTTKLFLPICLIVIL